jgi:hypothetical protein
MIVRSVCNSCLESYLITLMPGDMDLVKQIVDPTGRTAPCPRLCGGRINIVGEPTIADLHKKLKKETIGLTGKQLYQAIHGAGLPDEIPKDLLVITSLLKAHKIVASEVELAYDRFYLHELTLENGVTLHFSGGPRGAQITKITKDRKKETDGLAPAV